MKQPQYSVSWAESFTTIYDHSKKDLSCWELEQSEKQNFQKLLYWEHFLYSKYFNIF